MTDNVVIGANGMVGRALMEHLSDAVGTYHTSRDNLIPDRRYEYLDITSTSHLYYFLEQNKPQKVFIAAANAHVDGCESTDSDKVNERAIKNIINNCYRLRSKVIFFSSSYVFEGNETHPYKTTDKTFPINRYGRQKETIEKFLADFKDSLEWLVIRTVGVFGKEGTPKNFVSQVKKAIEENRRLLVPVDQTMNPVWAMDLAKTTIHISNRYMCDIFHVAGNRCITKYDFAVKVAYALGHPKPHDFIVGVKSEDMKQIAQRPKNGCLDCGKLRTVAIRVPSFSKGLKSYLGS